MFKDQFPKTLRFLAFVLIALWAFASCNKSSSFGADLLEDEAADLVYTDTVSFQITLVKEDSILTSDATSVSTFMLCGKIEEPVFGESEAILYTALRPQFGFNFNAGTVVDSVSLILGYDPSATYGDTMAMHTFEVYQLDSAVVANTRYFSNKSFPYPNQIGSLSFMPKPNVIYPLIDSSNLSVTGRDSVNGAYLRIPLDKAFGQSIIDLDSIDLANDTFFVQKTRGLAIRSTQAGAMLGFDMNDALFSHIVIHYSQGDTLHRDFKIRFGGANKFIQFKHDRPSTITDKIGQVANDKIYLQGMSGIKAKVTFPNISTLKGLLINKAELQFTLDDQNGVDLLKFAAPKQLIYTRNQGDSLFVVGPDATYSLGAAGGSFVTFGGTPKIENSKTVYRINISEYLQDMILGNQAPELYLNVYPQANSTGRVALYGPDNVSFPAKLNIKYTKIQ